MAIKKGGLGRGIDGMFPSYVDADKNKDNKTAVKKSQAVKSPKAKGEGKAGTKATAKKSSGTKEKAAEEKKTFIKEAEEETVIANTKEEDLNAAVNTPDTEAADAPVTDKSVVMIRLSDVEPNKDQPRKYFEEDALTELADSIQQFGVIQPLLVQKKGDFYEIIAGERRWRAAKLAGLKEIPVIIKEYSDQELVEISLIENIQREDLNPIEEAQAFQRLSEEFGLKQDEVAEKVSKSRTAVTNSLRLLKLDQRVQQMLIEEKISSGHARALLAIENSDIQYETAMRVFDEHLSVRDIEKLVRQMQKPAKAKPVLTKNTALDYIYQDMEERMKAILGTKVTLNRKTDKKGKIEIEYYSGEELERIFELLRSIDHGV